MKKIVFVGGGTLGHIFPMLPIVRKIKPNYELIFIGTTSGLEKALIQDKNLFDTEYYLDMQGFVRKLSFKNFTTFKKY
jgi:UDP-N-acetylglucosamine:LPS N-acetylglucosamine transferase